MRELQEIESCDTPSADPLREGWGLVGSWVGLNAIGFLLLWLAIRDGVDFSSVKVRLIGVMPFALWGWCQSWLLRLRGGPGILWVFAWMLPAASGEFPPQLTGFIVGALVLIAQTLALAVNRTHFILWPMSVVASLLISSYCLQTNRFAVDFLINAQLLPNAWGIFLRLPELAWCAWTLSFFVLQGLVLSFTLKPQPPRFGWSPLDDLE